MSNLLPEVEISIYVVSKVRSLAYLVVGMNDYYTSKNGPSCEKFVGAVTLRWLYCPSLQKSLLQ
jgi:predicted nucleic acid-binding Zn finger protein